MLLLPVTVTQGVYIYIPCYCYPVTARINKGNNLIIATLHLILDNSKWQLYSKVNETILL